MNLQQKMPTTADEFLRWNEGREGKREFVRGRVVEMMINVTRNHGDIATNLLLATAAAARPQGLRVSGRRISACGRRDGIRYPDVIVDRKTATRRRPTSPR